MPIFERDKEGEIQDQRTEQISVHTEILPVASNLLISTTQVKCSQPGEMQAPREGLLSPAKKLTWRTREASNH